MTVEEARAEVDAGLPALRDYRERPPVGAPYVLEWSVRGCVSALIAWIVIAAVGFGLAYLFGLIG
jgi:hypothetical protein